MQSVYSIGGEKGEGGQENEETDDLNLNLLINIDFATIKVEIHLSFTRLVILKEGYINIFTEVYLLKYTIINR